MSSGGAKTTKTEQSLFEEDDEFEEFPTEGRWLAKRYIHIYLEIYLAPINDL